MTTRKQNSKSRAGTPRKRVPNGTKLTVCGVTVSGKHNLICLLPASLSHKIHSSMALDKDGFLVVVHRIVGGEPTFQNVPVPEALQSELNGPS